MKCYTIQPHVVGLTVHTTTRQVVKSNYFYCPLQSGYISHWWHGHREAVYNRWQWVTDWIIQDIVMDVSETLSVVTLFLLLADEWIAICSHWQVYGNPAVGIFPWLWLICYILFWLGILCICILLYILPVCSRNLVSMYFVAYTFLYVLGILCLCILLHILSYMT